MTVCFIFLWTDQVEGLRMSGTISRLHLYANMECIGTTLHFYNASFCNVIAYMCVPAYICEGVFCVERVTWHVFGADIEYTSKGRNSDLHSMQWNQTFLFSLQKLHVNTWRKVVRRLLKKWNILVVLCPKEHNLGHSTWRLMINKCLFVCC